MGIIVTISAIMGILGVGVAIYLFTPATYYTAYTSGMYANLPPAFSIMRDQMYQIFLISGAIMGIGVTAIYVFQNAGKTEL